MIQGKYMASGCSSHWCSWREGKAAPPPGASKADPGREETMAAATSFPIVGEDSVPAGLTAVRRMLAENNRRLQEAEQVMRAMDEEFQRMRRSILVRGAAHLARRWDRLSGKTAAERRAN
jgi:hypothetical protein